MYDVIIVGAGPAGLYASYLYEKLGLNTIVIEEHKCIGAPRHCSGLVSWNIERFLNVPSDIIAVSYTHLTLPTKA